MPSLKEVPSSSHPAEARDLDDLARSSRLPWCLRPSAHVRRVANDDVLEPHASVCRKPTVGRFGGRSGRVGGQNLAAVRGDHVFCRRLRGADAVGGAGDSCAAALARPS